jgi:phenylalanyl-tRNA synthetase alpha chain
LSEEDRRLAGQALNEIKNSMNQRFQDRMNAFGASGDTQTFFDYSLPGDVGYVGSIHPISTILREIKSCFTSMGFSVRQGPEVETEYYNFDALNIEKGHPARDMQDTLFIDESNEIVLRTHTSPVQVHVMESQPPPVRIIAPGRCYRRDTPDATHSPVFHQVEGLCVDEGISFADLKGVIQTFAKRMFGSDMKIRFRPSFFPFTEPSAEYDFSCMICKGKGCRVCSGTGWVEISGAGMVNPAVFKAVGYDPEKYTGYAFGMGVERIAMLVYEVHDIRLFYENDMRFLLQF